jgi:transcriptional regulator with XRE-family HTH domain
MQLSDLGLFIRKERKAAGLSIQTLAELAGVDRTTLSKLENQRLPEMGYAKLERVLAVLGFELATRAVQGLPTLNDLQRQNRGGQ